MRSAGADDWPIFGRDAADVAWRPDPATARDARLARFLTATGEASLDALQARATGDPAWFWGAAADDIGVTWTRRPREIADMTGGPAWTRWWIGGSFDWSWAAVEPRAARDPDGTAVTWEGEDGAVRTLSNAELAAAVGGAARQLTGLGIGPGDRVGILLPMLLETVVAVLAVSRLGAIFTPIFSGYGAPAIASRLADCDARLLITADGFLRRGSWVDLKSVADAAVDAAPSVERVLVVRRAGDALDIRGTRTAMSGGSPAAPIHRLPTRPSTGTPRRRTWSSIRRARPAARRGRSTSTAASRSRPPRTSPTRST